VKLYLAGNGKSKGSSQRDYDVGARNRLLSYAFIDDWAKDEFVFWVDGRPHEASVFLDSGAFSAFTLGRKIDLDAYCEYVRKHTAAFHAYAVLDVIGDIRGTIANYERMRAKDLQPVPVFHVDREKLDLLETYLKDCRYVALGGMAASRPTREELQGKLDPCWRTIQRYWPVKVHGLGVMAQWALERYPFYSVDSSSAIVAAGMGRVVRFRRGVLTADGWREDVRRTRDGLVADGVGRVASSESKSKSAHEGRRIRNIQAQLAMERYITDLWTARGITWN
jgi:hypothetical protein